MTGMSPCSLNTGERSDDVLMLRYILRYTPSEEREHELV